MIASIRAVENTITGLLSFGNERSPAIASVNNDAVSYGELNQKIQNAHAHFRSFGITKTDVVAVSLRNSAETAELLLALLTYCRVAPLNPAYTIHELTFALADLKAVALLTSHEQEDARAAATQLNVRVIAVEEVFTPARNRPFSTADLPRPHDIALLLHTSGTTARPKLVPLTQRNLFLSSRAVAEVLQLTPADRCLSVMPMFHIHGLVAGLLASIAAGATSVCTPGFQATKFFTWLDDSAATWYSGVPTMHQTILSRARHNLDILQRHRLRLIRSSSSPLYPAVWEELESVFGVPVLNSYGMTEAAHQIASVRIGVGCATHATVGTSSGPKVQIMDENGNFLPPGQRGEVVLHGDQVMAGYLSPAAANEVAFCNGWFRTGDEGWLNLRGELTLTGRFKEMINSGGEKICPYEVEEALLGHLSVAEAVAFAAPHPMLGEQVMAAVVIREGHTLLERDLLRAVSSRLAPCKLPKKTLFLKEIPRGATGKLQRIGLAKLLLGISDPTPAPLSFATPQLQAE